MITGVCSGQRRTANQLAKELVWQYGEGSHYWAEKIESQYLKMTQREVDDVDAAVAKHWGRVQKFLGIPDNWYEG